MHSCNSQLRETPLAGWIPHSFILSFLLTVLQRSNNPEWMLWFTHADDCPCNQGELLWFLIPEVTPSHLSHSPKNSLIIPQAESEPLQPGAQQIEVDKQQFQLSVVSWVSVWSSAVALMRKLSQPCGRGESLLLPYVNRSHLSITSFHRWFFAHDSRAVWMVVQ